ncbi:hypothetical protein ACWDRR_04055 [Kitasatospora sp. NPDC003701]
MDLAQPEGVAERRQIHSDLATAHPSGAARRRHHNDADFRSSKLILVQSEPQRSRLGQAVADQAESATDDQSEKPAESQHQYEQTL